MTITDPMKARVLVYNIVVNWVGTAVNISPSQVDVSRTFSQAPSDGYGFTPGGFNKMCEEVTPQIVVASGRALNLPPKFRHDHAGDAIAVFIDAVALKLMAAAMTASGIRAHQFVMTR